MENNNLTPEESLTIISKAISNFKINYKESSKIFLLWGWVLSLASFSNFWILKILHANEAYNLMGLYSLLNWGIFCTIAFVLQFFILRKIKKQKKVYSYLDKYVQNLWQVTAIGFFVAIFIGIKLEIEAPPALMLLIAGIATATTGLLIKFKPMFYGGLAFFVFSIATTYAVNEYMALSTCAAIVIGYLIPGYMLKLAK